jgi:hypothetical protein
VPFVFVTETAQGPAVRQLQPTLRALQCLDARLFIHPCRERPRFSGGLLWSMNEKGKKYRIAPGEVRNFEVTVGSHLPPNAQSVSSGVSMALGFLVLRALLCNHPQRRRKRIACVAEAGQCHPHEVAGASAGSGRVQL